MTITNGTAPADEDCSSLSGGCGGGILNNAAGDIYGHPNGTTTPNAGAMEFPSAVDPLLGTLSGNPATHLPRAGSPANNLVPVSDCTFISTGTNPLFSDGAFVATDQNSKPRPVESQCDAGAVEIAYTFIPIVLK